MSYCVSSVFTTPRLFRSDINFVMSVRLRETADKAVVRFCFKRLTRSSLPFSVNFRVLFDSSIESLSKFSSAFSSTIFGLSSATSKPLFVSSDLSSVFPCVTSSSLNDPLFKHAFSFDDILDFFVKLRRTERFERCVGWYGMNSQIEAKNFRNKCECETFSQAIV